MYRKRLIFDPIRHIESMSKFMHNEDKDEQKNEGFLPNVDIINEETNITIFADMPGIAKEEIKISVDDENIMSISGSKKKSEIAQGEKERTFYRTERKFGEFTRKILLPENYDDEKITANFENGVLEMNIGIKEPQKPKQIEVTIN